jgi:hypothetical protein
VTDVAAVEVEVKGRGRETANMRDGDSCQMMNMYRNEKKTGDVETYPSTKKETDQQALRSISDFHSSSEWNARADIQ